MIFIKTLTLLIFNLNTASFATKLATESCPNAFEFQKQNYCATVEWQRAEKKNKTFKEAGPYLNAQGSKGHLWYYSKGVLKVWPEGHPMHLETQLFTPSLYMKMINGHHHPGSLRFEVSKSGIQLSGLALQAMEGCWFLEIHSATESQLDSNSGQKLKSLQISNYVNLDVMENYDQEMFCSMCSGQSAEGSDHGGHHHDGHHGSHSGHSMNHGGHDHESESHNGSNEHNLKH